MYPDQELYQLESRTYGDLLRQIRYWEAQGYDLVETTRRRRHWYIALIRKRVDSRPVNLVVTIGTPKNK